MKKYLYKLSALILIITAICGFAAQSAFARIYNPPVVSPTQSIIDTGGQVYNVKAYGATGDGSTDDTAAVSATISAVGSNGGVVYFPCGAYKLASGITVSKTGINFVGSGHCSTLRIPHTSDALTITGSLFKIQDIEFLVTATSTRTGSLLLNIQANQGFVNNVRFTGAATINNGGVAYLNGNSADLWTFNNVSMPGGVTWDYGLKAQTATGTVADTHIIGWRALNTITFQTAGFLIDQGIDTFNVTDSNPGPVILQNSGANINPRWVHFTNSYIEAGVSGVISGTGLNIQAGRDINYQGYIATSDTGIIVGSSTNDINIHDSQILNIGQSAVTIAASSSAVNIHNNVLEDIGVTANNTYDSISVASSTSGFKISGNTFTTFSAVNLPRYFVSVAAGGPSNNWTIASNIFPIAAGTDYINVASVSGNNNTLEGNSPYDSSLIKFGNILQYIPNTVKSVFLGNAPTTTTSGNQNTGLGIGVFNALTSGSNNAGVGYFTLHALTSGSSNNAFGNVALQKVLNGSSNNAFGASSLANLTSGNNNIGVGVSTLAAITTTSGNTAIGYQSGSALTGSNNTFIGTNAASTTSSGSGNIAIGNQVSIPSITGSNQLNIGNLIYGTALDGTLGTISTGNIGIGTTTPQSRFFIKAAASTDAFAVGSADDTAKLLRVNDKGHMGSGGTAPTVQSCGGSPSINGTDADGRITVGSAATSCQIIFANAYATSPHCVVSEETQSIVNAFSYTASTTGMVFNQTALSGAGINYICKGI